MTQPKLAIITSQTNYDHTYLMELRALDHAKFLGCEVVVQAYSPGVYDMPLILKTVLQRQDVDAVITLGTIIKGESDHDTLIAHQVARKITDLSLEHNKPVALGISGPGLTMMQSKARIESFATNAVEAAVKLFRQINEIK
jgi:6,7-dimethyl-8-ribityllumazine synthase